MTYSQSQPKENAVGFLDGRFDEQHVVVIAGGKPGESFVTFEFALSSLKHVLIGVRLKMKARLWSRSERILEVTVGSARHAYLDAGRRGPFLENLSELPMIAFEFVEPVDEEANAVAG
jgi:hypothetical protein